MFMLMISKVMGLKVISLLQPAVNQFHPVQTQNVDKGQAVTE